MTKYINSEKLKELIDEKWKELANRELKVGGNKWDIEINTYLSVLTLIDSLQQKQSDDNIEEKARAYDKIIRKAQDVSHTSEFIKIYDLFPQLAESEDEKIRKVLISYFEWVKERDCKSEWNGLKVDDIRTWLEKQKENTWSEEDDAKVKAMCEEGYLKPSERAWLKDLSNRVWKEQKPVEWSEEDNKNMSVIKIALQNAKSKAPREYESSGKTVTYEEYEKAEDWLLKSLLPQPRVKTNDYITPHKEFFEWIYNRLINVHNENPNVDYMQSFKKRIDNLQFDEPQWKPSEQEKGALRTAIHVLTEERNFPKAAGHLQAILDAFDGKESRKD